MKAKKRISAGRMAGGTWAGGASIGGTYVYSKELGKLVKVSDRVPKVASKRGGAAPSGMGCGEGPCCGGGGACGGGACGMA